MDSSRVGQLEADPPTCCHGQSIQRADPSTNNASFSRSIIELFVVNDARHGENESRLTVWFMHFHARL